MDLLAGIDSGALVWLALALTGAALIAGGVIVLLTGKTGSARVLAGTAVAVGVVMWAVLLFTLPVSSKVEYGVDPTAPEARTYSTLPQPAEATVRSSYGSDGDEEGQFIQILESDLELQQLYDHYQQEIRQQGGTLSSELVDPILSVLTWEFLDAENRQGNRVL